MIITRTPFRISFFGGGTDYPTYYQQQDGMVLSTSIDKYCTIMVRYLPPYFDYNYRIRYGVTEEISAVSEIQHPSVKACLELMDIKKGLELVHSSDIPARSGVGSSSAFTVGLLHALSALKGVKVTKSELCQDALHIEQQVLKENVGSQDQTAASYGGFNSIIFRKDKQPLVSPIPIKRERREELEKNLMLFFTGFSRISSTVAAEQIKNTPDKGRELAAMKELASNALTLLDSEKSSLREFGELMHESWMIKKTLTNKISNAIIDSFYERALSAGAIGGKLCGAGAGGFLLLYVPPENQNDVKNELSDLLHVPFEFEYKGTHLIYDV